MFSTFMLTSRDKEEKRTPRLIFPFLLYAHFKPIRLARSQWLETIAIVGGSAQKQVVKE